MLQRILNKTNRVFSSLQRDLRIFVYNEFTRRRQMKRLPLKLKNVQPHRELKNYNASKIRSVEVQAQDLNLKQLIVTCYFTLKPDPQSGSIRSASNFEYIQPWYDSMTKIGATGIVLHDGLDDAFISRYTSDQIQFRYCELGNYSIFEERWLLYHLLLDQLPNLENVFFTDSNDVYITKNPFSFITNDLTLYVGRDNANRIKDSGWLKLECDRFIEESNFNLPKTYSYQWVYNAGVSGGSRGLMYFFTAEISKLIFCAKSNYHKDMTLLNLVIHEHFYPKLSAANWHQQLVNTNNDKEAAHTNLVTGYPFNSGFKDFDLNSNAIFIHK